MLTEVLTVSTEQPDPGSIQKAAKAIQAGKLVVFPTETVYGIAANALDQTAINKLCEIKNRPKEKPLTWHIAEISQLKDSINETPVGLDNLLEAFWPGPLTVIVKTKNGEKQGFRMPDHPVALALIRHCNVPLVAPSANLSGEKPPTTAEEALKALDGVVDLVLDAGKTALKRESTVIDMTQTPPKVLREGAIKEKTLQEWFKGQQ